MGENNLPWLCEEHPNAQIRHTWDEDRYVLNQVEVSRMGFNRRNHKYECDRCGKELAPPTEEKK